MSIRSAWQEVSTASRGAPVALSVCGRPVARSACGIKADVVDWPKWASEEVEIRPADPAWLRLGARLRRQLDAAPSRWLVAPVEHVGSTAIPGLAAKPILDFQSAVANLECAPAAVDSLGEGWHLVPPDLDARPWRRFLVQVVEDVRTAHPHVLTPDSGRWAEQLAFRDALRANPRLVQRYAELKQELAKRHAHDREAYSAAKTRFIMSGLREPASQDRSPRDADAGCRPVERAFKSG